MTAFALSALSALAVLSAAPPALAGTASAPIRTAGPAASAPASAAVAPAAKSAPERALPGSDARTAASAEAAGKAGLYWYERGRKRELLADAAVEVEFAPGRPDAAQPRLVSKAAPGEAGRPRSPLLRDPHGGAPRALPGGVIVALAAGTAAIDAASARARLEAAGLEPLRAIVGHRIWLVAAPAGLAALELANRLHESGRFAWAQPNWWEPRALK